MKGFSFEKIKDPGITNPTYQVRYGGEFVCFMKEPTVAKARKAIYDMGYVDEQDFFNKSVERNLRSIGL